MDEATPAKTGEHTDMSSCDEYNGWSNRETWCTSLHLSNDEGLYNWVNELATAALEDAEVNPSDILTVVQGARYSVSGSLCAAFEEWEADMVDGEPQTRDLRMMLTDIGSLYRVDWDEVATSWLDDLQV